VVRKSTSDVASRVMAMTAIQRLMSERLRGNSISLFLDDSVVGFDGFAV